MDEPALIFPLALISACLGSVAIRLLRTRHWGRANAEVIAIGPAYSAGDGTVAAPMHPTVRYATVAGERIVLDDKRLALGPALVVEQIKIRYSPLDPQKVVAVSALKRFRVEIGLLGFGGMAMNLMLLRSCA